MDLWIRTQNRNSLVCCNDISIEVDSKDNQSIRGYKVVGYFDKNTEYKDLGFYINKRRALDILDEIQETICIDKFNYEDTDKMCYQDCYRYKSDIIAVYEMPKE